MNSTDDETEPLGESPEVSVVDKIINGANRIATQAVAIERIRVARDEYEAALARREHGLVAAHRFIDAVTAQLDGLDD